MSIKRKQATSPLSQNWTLYSPKALAEKLGLPVEQVSKALEETGFNKAVRVRECIIKRKIVIQKLVSENDKEIRSHQVAIYKLRQENKGLRNEVTGLRNALRIPRENIKLDDAVVIGEIKRLKIKAA